MRALTVFEGLRPAGRIGVTVALVALVGALDYLTGFELSFAFFYVLPVGLAAWSLGRRAGLITSVASAVVWAVANQLAGNPQTAIPLLVWNTGTRLGFFVVVTELMTRQRRALERERTLSRTDGLTGVLNGRAFYEVLAVEIARARRYARPLAVAYVDLDDFKTVNDRFGHATGDALLQTVAKMLLASIRRSDSVARLGGDEFAVLFPEATAGAARRAAETMRERLLAAMRAQDWPVTFSIGVLACPTCPESPDALIARADALMYDVKRATKDGIAFGEFEERLPAAAGGTERPG